VGTVPIQPADTSRRTAIALIVMDEHGVSIDAVLNGVTYRTPSPLSADAATAYIRLLLDGARR
jgi:hypothetical protein